MQQPTEQSFGLVIAYLIPGFTALWGVSLFSETVATWLGPEATGPSVGGFLFGTLASIGAGLIVSAVRWMLVDRVHHWTGLRRPSWNMVALQRHLDAFKLLVEDHYRYYQFYANMWVACILSYAAYNIAYGFLSSGNSVADVAFLLLLVVLFAASRNTLKKYYERTAELLGRPCQ